jgi:hypothetical protein
MALRFRSAYATGTSSARLALIVRNRPLSFDQAQRSMFS